MIADPRRLIYIGPAHAEHPTLGALVPGQAYPVERALAEYWLVQSPEHWQDGAPAPSTTATPRDTDEE
jgi:hypothetical protein